MKPTMDSLSHAKAYIPNVITVLVAWLSFLLCPETAIPARVTLSISSLIAMVLQYGNVAENIPKVGYLRSFDIWMISCVTFVFFTITQFALSQQLRRSTLKKLIHKGVARQEAEESATKKQHHIDHVCSCAYLLCFTTFCAVYFITVLYY